MTKHCAGPTAILVNVWHFFQIHSADAQNTWRCVGPQSSCRSAFCSKEANLRHHQCAGRNKADWEKVQEQCTVDVSNCLLDLLSASGWFCAHFWVLFLVSCKVSTNGFFKLSHAEVNLVIHRNSVVWFIAYSCLVFAPFYHRKYQAHATEVLTIQPNGRRKNQANPAVTQHSWLA